MQRPIKFRCLIIFALVLIGLTARAELQPESLGQVRSLPEQYPPHWLLVHDVAFFHILDGRTILLDADENTIAQQYKGTINNSFAAQILQATRRPEIYVAETYYSRGTRGERTDVLTIYDKRTLSPDDEVLLDNNSRSIVLPQKYLMRLTDNERLLLIYNFSPAMSVSVVDVEKRAYLNTVTLPGCAAIYPTGKRGFSSLCGDGALFTVTLDSTGQVESSVRSEKFFDVDADALMEKPAWIDGRAYFPTFTGNIHPIDFRRDQPRIGNPWPMTDEETRGWRPGGLAPAEADANGRIYILVHPDGGEGSHKAPGAEVWVFDPEKKTRLARHALEVPGLSLALTRDKESPLMVITNVEMQLDVYDAGSGELLRTIANFGGETPFLVYGAE